MSITTLRRWEAEGRLLAEHTAGGHRRYDLAKLLPEHFRARQQPGRETIAYARVSSHDQRDDLERQKQVLERYCARQGWTFEVIANLGSGMNYRMKGLKRLLEAIIDGSVGRPVIAHKDRLLRFGAELAFAICEAKGVEVVILNQGEDTTFEEDLAKDVLEITTVFSSRLYGSRSHKNQKSAGRRAGGGGRIRDMLIAHRIALDPTNKQRTYFARASGTARFAWNWALAEWLRQYAATKDDPSLPQPSDASLRRQLNSLKREEFPWMFDVTKCAAQEAIIDLGVAFRSFFEKRGRYPRFKKKGVRDSFCAANETGTFRADGERIKLPVVGWVRMREAVRFTGKLKRVTVSREADRWFVSIMVETEDIKPLERPQDAIGVDLGVSTLATLSDGTAITGPKAHKVLLGRLRRTSRSLSRKRKGSANRCKAKAKLARLHSRIASIRRDVTHKATTMLAKTYRRIGIEDLNVRSMARNRHLARSIMDGGFYEFRRQLEYKARFYGATVVVADRWFPSSKTCSCCGSVKTELALSQRTYHCDTCGHEINRDLNAARNLERLAASSAVSACGEERSGARRKPRVKRTSTKQEPNSSLAA